MIWDKFKKLIPIFLILGGIGLIALAIAADYLLGGGQSGFGFKQYILLWIGVVVLGSGGFLALPLSRRIIKLYYPSTAENSRSVSVLLLAVWSGLLTGFSEVAILSYRKFFQHQVINKAKDYAWMIPVGDLLLFLTAGSILFLLYRRWANSSSLRISAMIFSFLGFSSILFMFPSVHIIASLLLAAGLALQISRYVSIHKDGFYWFVRFIFLGEAIIFFVLLFSTLGWKTLSEQQAFSKLPSNSPHSPNVLLVVLDTVRAQDLSLYGYDRPTSPQLERLAHRGTLFQHAISTAPWTLPSHLSMFTGLWLHEQTVGFREGFNGNFTTLAEGLAAQGYNTAGFVANTYYCSYEHGLNIGFAHYEDYTVSLEQSILSTSLANKIVTELGRFIGNNRLYLPKTAGDVNSEFLQWLSHHKDRPFFAFLNYFDAHLPYLPPEPFDSLFGSQSQRANPIVKPKYKWSSQDIQAEIDAYDGAIAYIDDQLGKLYDDLDKQGLIENTIIIVVSDHGEQLGEHNLFDHGNSLYIQAIYVPLLIIFPSEVPEGKTVVSPISLRDLPETVVDLAGLGDEINFPGKSLTRFWADGNGVSPSGPEFILSEMEREVIKYDWYPIAKGDMKSSIINNYHYIVNGDDHEELYDYIEDPSEKKDLSNTSDGRHVIELFRAKMKVYAPNFKTYEASGVEAGQ